MNRHCNLAPHIITNMYIDVPVLIAIQYVPEDKFRAVSYITRKHNTRNILHHVYKPFK